MKKKIPLPVVLSDVELVERRVAQGKALKKLESEEAEAKEAAAEHRELVKGAREAFHQLARVVATGQEIRDVEVKRGEGGLLYRLDTGELVNEPLEGSAADRTLDLPLDEGDDLGEPADGTPSGVVLERPKKAKGKKVSEDSAILRTLLDEMKAGEWYVWQDLERLSGLDIVQLGGAIEVLVSCGQIEEVKLKGKARFRLAETSAEAAQLHGGP